MEIWLQALLFLVIGTVLWLLRQKTDGEKGVLLARVSGTMFGLSIYWVSVAIFGKTATWIAAILLALALLLYGIGSWCYDEWRYKHRK